MLPFTIAIFSAKTNNSPLENPRHNPNKKYVKTYMAKKTKPPRESLKDRKV